MFSKRVLVPLLALIFVHGMLSAMSPQDAMDLISAVEDTVYPAVYEANLTIVNDKPGSSTESTVKVMRKGDNLTVLFLGPEIQKNQVLLRNGEKMWMYLPNAGKTLRVGAKEMSMGGQASNADMMRLGIQADYSATLIGEESLEGSKCYKFELTAKHRSAPYDRFYYWISIEDKLPVRKELYTISGKVIKNIYYKEPTVLAGQLIPSLVIIENAENPALRTTMKTTGMSRTLTVLDNVFTLAYVQRGQVK